MASFPPVAKRRPTCSRNCSLAEPSHVGTSGRVSDKKDVHVWFAFLDELMPCFDSLFATLSADEVERARQFPFQNHRNQYVISRGFLREVLSRSSGVHPCELRFRHGPCGKPALVEEAGGEELAFNLSHAQGAVVCAVAHDREVGVDLEYLRKDIDDRELAERFFSPRESAVLMRLPFEARQEAFFTCWTRKEAFIKARGQGLSLDLRSFDVFNSSDLTPRLHVESDSREAARWTLMDLDVPAGYIAALVIEGDANRVRCRQWPGTFRRPRMDVEGKIRRRQVSIPGSCIRS